ncbi:unnamed protein product [Acanthoscelides obtectus]|uniref:Uncharacterized protein n=1 Tax=Acanthoscelides obtectus TaxID=200917 RepID=A0A9P0KZJ0_ACAOB|nr:unnamed protein product [Acanthoscelides obtectus]CAK1625175.1 hypothetical protein AOBTE_LOCUS3008 [Acanthoscelides obtectus]
MELTFKIVKPSFYLSMAFKTPVSDRNLLLGKFPKAEQLQRGMAEANTKTGPTEPLQKEFSLFMTTFKPFQNM